MVHRIRRWLRQTRRPRQPANTPAPASYARPTAPIPAPKPRCGCHHLATPAPSNTDTFLWATGHGFDIRTRPNRKEDR